MKTGDRLPVFRLQASDRQWQTVAPGQGSGATLILFICNHCPYVHKYAARIRRMVSDYGHLGLRIWAINSNDVVRQPADSFDQMPAIADLIGLPGSYLYDATQDVARLFQAERTPEAFLFNSDGHLVYQGAIDDNAEHVREVEQHYLRDAIESVLTNQQIQNQYIPPAGCTIKWKHHG